MTGRRLEVTSSEANEANNILESIYGLLPLASDLNLDLDTSINIFPSALVVYTQLYDITIVECMRA